jgi:hypothetical protein
MESDSPFSEDENDNPINLVDERYIHWKTPRSEFYITAKRDRLTPGDIHFEVFNNRFDEEPRFNLRLSGIMAVKFIRGMSDTNLFQAKRAFDFLDKS